MKIIDRVAEIPIRHRFVNYVCSIGYSEFDEEFKFIAARYADAAKTERPANEFDLYLRILREPALRAKMLEALTPGRTQQILELREQAVSERGRDLGLYAGFVAFLLVGFALYELTLLLEKRVGNDWAEMITFTPMFFAFIVIFPVQALVEGWHSRRYCAKHSHRLETFKSNDGREITKCRRCGPQFESNEHLQ